MENDLLLIDRINAIKVANSKYNLLENSYISFSGGKDSTVLHYLIDMALPNNNIPRVFINTGIEYLDIIKFVKELQKNDNRFIIITPTTPIVKVLELYGYPFKSKQHSHYLSIFQHSGYSKSVSRYLNLIESTTKIHCPKKLLYQFTFNFDIRVSDMCCTKLKKQPAQKWAKSNNKSICITGMRSAEGGQRLNLGCIVSNNDGSISKFHPLVKINDDWEKWFITNYNIKLCNLYYPPFNFERTGCKGCPFSLLLKSQLDTMEKLLPFEFKQCNYIWGKVYNEYKRINYRL